MNESKRLPNSPGGTTGRGSENGPYIPTEQPTPVAVGKTGRREGRQQTESVEEPTSPWGARSQLLLAFGRREDGFERVKSGLGVRARG